MSLHTCPATGCPIKVPRSTPMCKAHWNLVPREVRGMLMAAWRGYQKGTVPFSDYWAARRTAISAVNGALAAQEEPAEPRGPGPREGEAEEARGAP